ncbi:hypothetical protein [Gemmatimonas sp.]
MMARVHPGDSAVRIAAARAAYRAADDTTPRCILRLSGAVLVAIVVLVLLIHLRAGSAR